MEQDSEDSRMVDGGEYPGREAGEIRPAPALYLLPVPMSDGPAAEVLPQRNIEILLGLSYFIVENVRESRRLLRRIFPDLDISALHFDELNRHTDLTEASAFLEPLRQGHPIGLMSDAGCPAVADPGSVIVELAHKESLKVVPLVGPSSILLGLMGSGFNGQGFTFHGYLPVKPHDRAEAIHSLESLSHRHDITQIFIETPYRNSSMLESLINALRPETRLCVAQNLTHPLEERIISKRVSEWRDFRPGEGFDRTPAIFLLYAGEADIADTSAGRKNGYRKSRGGKRR